MGELKGFFFSLSLSRRLDQKKVEKGEIETEREGYSSYRKAKPFKVTSEVEGRRSPGGFSHIPLDRGRRKGKPHSMFFCRLRSRVYSVCMKDRRRRPHRRLKGSDDGKTAPGATQLLV